MPAKTAYGKAIQEKLEKTFKHLEEELKGLRTGRPSTAIFENIKVEFYGNPSPINQVGSLNLTEDRTLVITPYDRSMLSKIEKAINASDIGLHAINDGIVIRVAFPTPTGEDRKKWVKKAKEQVEETKIALRNIRRDDLKKIKDDQKNSKITEDESKKAEEDITKVLKEYEDKCDLLFAKKEKEIMES